MFHPPTFHAESVMEPEKLDRPIHCICGNQVTMRGHLCVWTTCSKDPVPGWYVACDGQCIVAKITEGSA